MNLRYTVKTDTRLVFLVDKLLPRIHCCTGISWDVADGTEITATRIDDTGSATGEVYLADNGEPFAVFDSAIAAGLWDFATA